MNLSRHTHRVAISNRRLVAADDGGMSSRWKDYHIESPDHHRGLRTRMWSQISAGTGTPVHQDRHIMRQNRFLPRKPSHPTSRAGNDQARFEAVDWHRDTPDVTPRDGSTHLPSPM
jgi:Putative transposase